MKRVWLPIALAAVALFFITFLVVSRPRERSKIVTFGISPDSQSLAVGEKSGRVQVLSIREKEFQSVLSVPACGGKWVNAVALPGEDELICGGEKLRRVSRGGRGEELSIPESGGAYGSVVKIGADLVVITAKEQVVVVEGHSGRAKEILDDHTALYGDLRTSKDGKWLSASGHTVHVWAIGTAGVSGKRELKHSYYTFGPTAFADDRMYMGSQDGCVYVWAIPSWAELPRICADGGTVSQVAVSGDGKVLAMAARDVILFQAENGSKIATIGVHAEAGMAFLPDGSLVTAESRSVHRWRCAGDVCKFEAVWFDIP